MAVPNVIEGKRRDADNCG